MILDLFSGPRGWSEGLVKLGLSDVGIEWDHAACLTAKAAGHPSIRADVAAYPSEPFAGKVTGLIASPPCQAWSMAGKRKGELDRANCYTLGSRMAAGDDSTGWTAWEDERSPLVAQPVRWVRELRPDWVALEQVPPVVDLWRHFARIFAGWGYSTAVAVLNAADFGVPQTRQRAFLLASRVAAVAMPSPTHGKTAADDLFGACREPWVTMAEALGWGMDERPSVTVTAGGGRQGGPDPLDGGSGARLAIKRERERERERERGAWVQRERSGDRAEEGFSAADEPAQTLTSKARSWTVHDGWALAGAGPAAERTAGQRPRRLDEPAHTVTGADTGQWVFRRPATTVCADPRIAEPDYRGGRRAHELGLVGTDPRQRSGSAEASVRVTVVEASVLQSFRPDYPWQGSRTKQFEQIGNAVPPLLAAHVLSAVTGIPLPVAGVAA